MEKVFLLFYFASVDGLDLCEIKFGHFKSMIIAVW